MNPAELPILVKMQTGLQGLERGQALSPNGQVLLAELGGDEFFMPKLIGLLQAAAVAARYAPHGLNAALKALPNWVGPRFTAAFNLLLNNSGFNRMEFINGVNKLSNADPTLRLLIVNAARLSGQAANPTIASWLNVSPKVAGWLTTLIRAVPKNTAF